jgi:hypothetical protein
LMDYFMDQMNIYGYKTILLGENSGEVHKYDFSDGTTSHCVRFRLIHIVDTDRHTHTSLATPAHLVPKRIFLKIYTPNWHILRIN